MKRIVEAKKLFEYTEATDLKKLKSTYRNLIKENHPDKFTDEDQKEAAEIQSKHIIEAYHLLVSTHPETQAANLEEYTKTVNEATIDDYQYKQSNLKITFTDGSVYEYFGVPKNVYNKLNSAPSLGRFARRHVFHSFIYRNLNKEFKS